MIALFILSAKAALLSAMLWAQRNWRFIAGGILVLAAVLLIYRACGTPEEQKPTLTPLETVQAQQAIETHDTAVMREVLVQSDARAKVADQTAVNAKIERVNAIQESKERWKDAEAEEMAQELERRARESQ